MKPPDKVVEAAIRAASHATCQSKRGAVLFTDGPEGLRILGVGWNRFPLGGDCAGGPECKRTCRYTAVHAEQAALLDAAEKGHGKLSIWADMLHLKVDNVGFPQSSGPPSCIECAKLLYHAGIVGVWLLHPDDRGGWRRYDAQSFYRLSVTHDRDLRRLRETYVP